MLKPPLCPSSSPEVLRYQIYLQYIHYVPHLASFVSGGSRLPSSQSLCRDMGKCTNAWELALSFPCKLGERAPECLQETLLPPPPTSMQTSVFWVRWYVGKLENAPCGAPDPQLESSVTAFPVEDTPLRGIPHYPWKPERGEENIYAELVFSIRNKSRQVS